MNIIPLIADLPDVNSKQLFDFACSAGAIGGLILVFKAILPKPRTPAIEAEFVTKVEFTKAIDEVRREMRRGEEIQQEGKMELLAAGEQRAKAIHERLNEMLAAVSRIDERTKNL